ncbi:MAG: hypothetical protein ACLQIQ_19745 [Beijerinckiaceae bacterium]
MMLRSVRPCVTALLFFCPAAAPQVAASAAEYSGVYEGTIGAARVVVELGDTSGTYFYSTKGTDIFLQVSAKNGAIAVVEKSGEDADSLAPTGRWSVKADGSHLSGTWSPPKRGRTLPINLTRVAALVQRPQNDDPTGHAGGSMAYGQRWIAARLQWTLGREIPVGDLSYAVATDSIFGTHMPRLVRFADAGRKAKINEAIERLQVEKILDARETSISLRQSLAGRENKSIDATAEANPESEQDLRITELVPDALSFVIRGSWNGGGAHPNSYVAAYTIDLVQAEPVEGTLLSRDEKTPRDKIFDGVLNLDEPENRLAFETLWVGKLRASLPEIAAKSDDDADNACSEEIKSPGFLDSEGSTYALYLVDGGLAVHPTSWPNVVAYCFTEFKYVPVVLTIGELKPFIAPGRSLIGMK